MRILIAIDGSPHGEVVVQAAARILRRAEAPALQLCTVIDASEVHATQVRFPGAEIPRGVGWAGPGLAPQGPSARTAEDRARALARMRDEGEQRLSHLAAMHLAAHEVETRVEIAEGATRAIVNAAERFGADLLFLGTHGRSGLRRMVLGSVAQAVVHHSDVPAVLVRELPPAPAGVDTPPQMLLPTDGSRRVRAALPRAGVLAGALGATVTLIQVMERSSLVVQSTISAQRRAIERELEEGIAQLAAAGVRAEGAVLEGDPPRAVVGAARERAAELMLVPTHDRSEAGRIVFGSVADRLIHDAPCPVALLKARQA